MHFSGNLSDVSIIDVLQILGLTGKPGQLDIEHTNRRAEIVLAAGRISAASLHPNIGYMTNYLLQRGEVDFETLHEALELQRCQPAQDRRPIGTFLVELGAITEAQLKQALHEHIQAVMNEVASWTTGAFSFVLAERQSSDEYGLNPVDLTANMDFNIQELLLEAACAYDEARHEAPQSASHPLGDSGLRLSASEAAQASTVEPAPILLVTDDLLIQYGIGNLDCGHRVETVSTLEMLDRRLQSDAVAPITVVLDVDLAAANSEQPADLLGTMQRLTEQSDAAAIVTFGCTAPPPLLELMQTGRIRYHIPRPSLDALGDPAVARSFVDTVTSQAQAAVLDNRVTSPAPVGGDQSQVWERLYGRIMSLRRTRGSLTVCRELLRYVAEDHERAVLLAVHKDHLVALGLVGVDGLADEAPMDGSLRVALSPDSIFATVVNDQHMDRVEITEETEDDTLDALYEHMGPPTRPEALIIPMVVRGRTFAVIYADNGARTEPLGSIEAVGILVEHGSQLLENMWLSRRSKRATAQPTRAIQSVAAEVTIES